MSREDTHDCMIVEVVWEETHYNNFLLACDCSIVSFLNWLLS
jgi:hypothetical protein